MSDISQQLIDQVREALDKKQALHVQGNNTKAFMGRQSKPASAKVISVAEHSGILKYEPVELVMTARAGTTLAEIDAALEENQQMLASDPARFSGQATIGGSLAANQSGPARPWIGSLRDHVLGVSLINGKAEHLRFGGQVMKNVAGYDVSRLQAGAMGTLGVMTELSFKVLPKPAASMTQTLSISADDAIELMNQLAGTPKPINGAAWVNETLYVRLSGSLTSVESSASEWQQKWNFNALPEGEADSFWKTLRDQELDYFSGDDMLWRFSIKSTSKVSQLDVPSASWAIDWCGAQRWLKGKYSHTDLQEWALENGGEVVLYRGAKNEVDVYCQPTPAFLRLQKNIKQALDPENIFNLGRLYPQT
ncbi:MAG: glycolate oxidase subunit GlcE [Cellvibrionaceae bacterium]